GGRPAGGTPAEPVHGVSIDTRTLVPGDLFVALPGTRADGHDHAAEAAARGAAALLVHRDLQPPPGPGGRPVAVVRVSDTGRALSDLARSAHAGLAAAGTRTVGITGSAGKTTTKDLLAHVLAGHIRHPDSVVAPPGSFNNEIGLPLTVARAAAADPSPAFLVLEMGARGVGHIAGLCRVAAPDVGVVLMVGSAHLSEFGSREGIARAKGELVEALSGTGVAVLNADDPLVMGMAPRTAGRVVTFGTAPGPDVAAAGVEVGPDARARFVLTAGGAEAPVRLPVPGDHQVVNALAAAAVAVVEGMDVATVAARLSAPGATSPHRMAVTRRPDGITIVDDAYNASPETVASALRSLATLGRGATGRTWAVLGPMLELGGESAAEHDRIGRLAVRLNVSRLVAVGEEARALELGARQEGSWGGESTWVPDAAGAARILEAELAPGDVVLLKASNAAGLWRLAARLAAGSPAGDPREEVAAP
ncbi:MAG: UDP-N-acetylmuramoyl-tripeptide--D-alanyl-D-alanine ligase, partial [Kineosporiaceae bacterium]